MGYAEQPADDRRVEALWTARADAGAPAWQPRWIPGDVSVDVLIRAVGSSPLRVQVVAPNAGGYEAGLEAGEVAAGVRFRPGAAGVLLAQPERVAALISEAGLSAGGCPRRLLAALQGLLDEAGPPPALVEDFLALSLAQHGRVDAVAASLGAHERALQRAAARWIGMTPKSFLRVTRAREAYAVLRDGERIAEVAAALGFADQAHLTRDLKHILGVTPGQARLSGSFKTAADDAR